MNDAPERIWLQDDGDYSKARLALSDLTWCEDQINDADTEYRRADLAVTDAEIMAHPKVKALVEILQLGVDLIDGNAVGAEWKKQSRQFIGRGKVALRNLKGE